MTLKEKILAIWADDKPNVAVRMLDAAKATNDSKPVDNIIEKLEEIENILTYDDPVCDKVTSVKNLVEDLRDL